MGTDTVKVFPLLLQFFLDLFGRWELWVETVVGYADGGIDAVEGVLGEDGVLGAADEESDAGIVACGGEDVIDHAHVACELAYVGKVELGDLDLNHTIAMEGYDVEEEVDVLFFACCLDAIFFSYEGEASAELEEEVLHVVDELILELGFVVGLADLGESELVGAFEEVACEVGFGCWKGEVEVVGRLSLDFVEVGLEHVFEHGSSPLVVYALVDVEEGFGLVAADFVEYGFVVAPGEEEDGCSGFALSWGQIVFGGG